MSEHPILSKQLSKRIRDLFKGASRQGVSRQSASRRSRPARTKKRAGSEKLKTAQTQPVQTQPASSQPPRPSATDKTDKKTDKNKTEKNKQTKHGKTATTPGKFWSDLIWVRPWLLVGGLWLSFVMMIAIALAGLSNPGQERVLEPISSSIAGQPLSAPDAAAAARLATRDGLSLAQRDPAATLPPEAVEQTMPTWPLLVMVAACAGGCMLMSRNEGLTRESRRGRRRMASVAPKPRPVAAAGNGRGSRKRRARRLGAERPGAQVMAFRKGQKIRRTPRQPKPVASKPVSFAMPKEAATQVTVVPEAETSPLDWKEGSLAHKLDVRQRRSINSFL